MANKKALLVWGGWSGHSPKDLAEMFSGWLQAEGFETIISDSLDSYLDKNLMNSLSLVVPNMSLAQITKEQCAGLTEAIRSGVGLAGCHGGIIDSFRSNTDYQWMTGGQWVAHPGNHIPKHRVHITDHEHPITSGIKDFDLLDTEQYWMHVDPQNHVMATTTITGEYGDPDLYKHGTVMPYVWTKMWGKGKVFVAAWGHAVKDFNGPEAKEIPRRGFLWAAR